MVNRLGDDWQAFGNGAIGATTIDPGAFTAAAFAADTFNQIADAVWDEARADHTAAGSFGQGAASVQGNITGISAEYRAATNEAETPYGTVLQQFRIKDHRIALFSYLDEDGMAFVVFDMDSRSVLYEDKLKENKIEPNSVMALAQVLPGLLDETKQIDSLELTPTGFKIDGKDYAVELNGIHVKTVNGNAIARENVYLVSKSHDELIERNKIDVADLSIGYVGKEYNTGNFIIAAIDSKSNVYTFTQDHKGKISLTVHQTR